MLEGVGLVTKERFVGYCSSPQLNRKQFDQLYEARLLMEPFAARRAAERMSEADIEVLAKLAASMAPGFSPTTYQLFADQDSQLHDLVAQGSGNSIIQDSLARLHSHLHIFRLRFHSEVTTEAHIEHAVLVDALRRRDGAMAEATMRSHIESSYKRLAPFTET
jgi:DNA-binding GntR family transcriptional regulator